MSTVADLDVAGRRRSPATLPGYHTGRAPRNKGRRYPADPPRVEEIVAVMRAAGEGIHAERVRALIAVLWRAGLRIREALEVCEGDLDKRRGAILVSSPAGCAGDPRRVKTALRRYFPLGPGKGDADARSAWTTGALSSCARGSPTARSCRLGRSSA